jgi:hypothetical protein
MDLATHIAKVLENDQKTRLKNTDDKKTFWMESLECEIFNAIQDLRADSRTLRERKN